MPHSGASRRNLRRQYIEARLPTAKVPGTFGEDGTLAEADYVEPENVVAVFSGRVVYQLGACRRGRRNLARETRFHTTGRPKRAQITKAGILAALKEREDARHVDA